MTGLRVLEVATYVAVPSAGALMADMGTDVTKVESSGGDTWRHFERFRELGYSERKLAGLRDGRIIPCPPAYGASGVVSVQLAHSDQLNSRGYAEEVNMLGTPINVEGIFSYRDNLRISHAVKAGNAIYISGQVALDPEGNVVGEGDAKAQAEYIWGNLEKVLQAAGSGLDEIVKIFVFAVGPESRDAAWEVRKGILGKDPLPCVTSIVISGLFRPGLLMEIDVVAVTGS